MCHFNRGCCSQRPTYSVYSTLKHRKSLAAAAATQCIERAFCFVLRYYKLSRCRAMLSLIAMWLHAGFGQNMHSRAHLQELQLGGLLANRGGGIPKLPHRGAWCVPFALSHTVQHVGPVYAMDRSMFSLPCVPTSMSRSHPPRLRAAIGFPGVSAIMSMS